jgi:hypothetical protein
MVLRHWLGFLFITSVALSSTGCISRPPPAYRQIDKNSTAYQEAHRLEAEKLLAQGKTSREAGKIADRRTTRQFTEAEKARRLELAKPLIDAWRAFEQPRGCWAYTATTTKREDGVTSVTVERFNPFEPEERIWTLLSRDGATPDEKTQLSYRREKLKAWRKQLKESASRPSKLKRIELDVLSEEFSSTSSEVTGDVTFVITTRPMKVHGLIDCPSSLESYTLTAAQLARTTSKQLGTLTVTLFPLIAHIDEGEQFSEYGLIDPALPPFILRTTVFFKARIYGKTMTTDVQVTYSDYQRVKCYDDRFEVNVGALDVIDFLPGSK